MVLIAPVPGHCLPFVLAHSVVIIQYGLFVVIYHDISHINDPCKVGTILTCP